ncbi:MAG TPA: translation initiation factor IF-3 [Patescibacteria group bacterium]|nr:translation initiation factor IF-3 [Patescibacteria group bacterium]
MNQYISAPKLRLIGEEGKQYGVVDRIEALKKARELEVDLVEVAPEANPPVARLIDFARFKYEQQKKEQDARKKQKKIDVKEVRLKPFVGDHDLHVRIKRIKEFLQDGDKVKVSVFFPGRQIVHKNFGYELLERIKAELGGVMEIERDPWFEGKRLVMFIQPSKEIKHGKAKNSEITQK